jgi:ABC-type multidrug transport system ATPase subunit
LGHNGAGKSTTINMLTGILKPDKGKMNIFGYDF